VEANLKDEQYPVIQNKGETCCQREECTRGAVKREKLGGYLRS
jgi:hypothetical protein